MTIAYDTETALFRPSMMAPELACVTYAGASGAGLLGNEDAHDALAAWLRSDERIVGQNVAYDFAVVAAKFPDLVPSIFAAYDADRVTDTMIRGQMIDIARGTYRGKIAQDGTWLKFGYSLDDLVRRLTGEQLKKDGWRMRYGSFLGLPLTSWTDVARGIQAEARVMRDVFVASGVKEKSLSKDGKAFLREIVAISNDDAAQVLKYPVDDAIWTLRVHDMQEKSTPPEVLVDQFRQARGAFALHLSTVHGLRTDAEAVEALRVATIAAGVDVEARLKAAGLVRPDGSKDTAAAKARMVLVCAEEGLPLRMTKGGKEKPGQKKPPSPPTICLDTDACEASGDELLQDYAEFSGLGKTHADIEMLEEGTRHPIHCRYGLAESGRTTCSKPNIQNLRKLTGIRECFVPRAGKVFIQGDYPQLELYTLAQCCYTWFGASTLGEMLKRGIDPHTAFAARLAGISYEEGVRRNKAKTTPDEVYFHKVLRPVSKPWNFGKPGGLGDKKMVALADTDAYGHVKITLDEAKHCSKVWLETFPEMPGYYARVNALLKNTAKLATVVLPGTGFVRGGAPYCAACNTGFQGLGAACAKNALWLVAKAEYAEPSSVLYGARTVWFVHDEIAVEADEATCHESAHELVRLMIEGANEFLPDVPYTVEKMADVPTGMRRWSKDATQVCSQGCDLKEDINHRFGGAHRLAPWEGKAA